MDRSVTDKGPHEEKRSLRSDDHGGGQRERLRSQAPYGENQQQRCTGDRRKPKGVPLTQRPAQMRRLLGRLNIFVAREPSRSRGEESDDSDQRKSAGEDRDTRKTLSVRHGLDIGHALADLDFARKRA